MNAFYDPGKEGNHIPDRGCEGPGGAGHRQLANTEGSAACKGKRRPCELVKSGREDLTSRGRGCMLTSSLPPASAHPP